MKKFRNFLIVFSLFSLILLLCAYYLYHTDALESKETNIVYVHENESTEVLYEELELSFGLRFPFLFKILAERMKLENGLKNGRYTIPAGSNMVEVIRIFREGKTKSVNLVIRPYLSLDELAGRCGNKLEADSFDFLMAFQDNVLLQSLGFNKETVYAMILPNTYNVLWHTSPNELMIYLKQAYSKFWNAERIKKLERCRLNALEVSILASIVAKETNKNDEMPMVAGMYINRLRKDMLLQADPTVKFAINEPGIQRIYSGHLLYNSPYNTYLYKGLPPGPICIPPVQAIDAVLDFTEHSYLFMCAREDFSGYHNFAKDYRSHQKNAARYRRALDERGIR